MTYPSRQALLFTNADRIGDSRVGESVLDVMDVILRD
jgi:hypothetical protein